MSFRLFIAPLFYSSKSVLFIVALLLLFPALTEAQNYVRTLYEESDGLPSSTIYDITQDKEGFIWFATENGLSRFDGKNFKNLTKKEGLPDNTILQVHGGVDGRIYFFAFNQSLYYYENN